MSDLPYELHPDTINDAATRSWNGFPLQAVVAHAIAKEIELGRLQLVENWRSLGPIPIPPTTEPPTMLVETAQTETTPAGEQFVIGITQETKEAVQEHALQNREAYELRTKQDENDRRRRRR